MHKNTGLRRDAVRNLRWVELPGRPATCLQQARTQKPNDLATRPPGGRWLGPRLWECFREWERKNLNERTRLFRKKTQTQWEAAVAGGGG